MSTQLETKIFKYNLLSSDAFPSSGVTEGSTIHIVDTGEEYIYHNGTWETDHRRAYALGMV